MNRRRWQLLTAIVGVFVSLPWSSHAQEKKDETAVGTIVTISRPAFLRVNKDATPIRLDPKKHAKFKLHPGEALRCDEGGGLKVNVYGTDVNIKPSKSWYPIPRVPRFLPIDPFFTRGAVQARAPSNSDDDQKKTVGHFYRLGAECRCGWDMRSGRPAKELYMALGGKNRTDAIVNAFVQITKNDIRVNSLFEYAMANETRLKEFKLELASLICQRAGGPCEVDHRAILAAVPGTNMKSVEFYSIIEDLEESFDQSGVNEGITAELVHNLVWFEVRPKGSAAGFRSRRTAKP